ncbi:hypothetical protein DM02DRAFT_734499 [Periconia macrospinosa]|uniref:Uncharacterized protein n=1 Tax=Periconia macrospinosa TaxID=97972 RepID=A0A2V1CY04_9PLEO|nr:hypothetical protein DM02DRAFT_734499 [Periconia macrospinosa]
MANSLPEADYIRMQIDEALEESDKETRKREDVILDNAGQTEVSQWLEMTRWPKYLQGYSFGEVAPLASPADPASEPILIEFSDSVDRIVEEAHRSIQNDKDHCRKKHGWQNLRKRGGAPRGTAKQHVPWETNVPCQRLVSNGYGAPFWRVDLSIDIRSGSEHKERNRAPGIGATSAAPSTWDQLEAQLDQRVVRQTAISASLRCPVHLSLWLEKTGWITHLQGHDFRAVAELLLPPAPGETGLVALLQSFDALIEDARESILSEKINVFALHRVNSFVRGRPFKKPLHTKLLDKTYRNYRAVWYKLLRYVYRLTISHQGPGLGP